MIDKRYCPSPFRLSLLELLELTEEMEVAFNVL